MPQMTREEMRRSLRAQGVGDGLIDRVIAHEFGDADPSPAATVAVLAWPLRFTVPWSALVSDNRKYGAQIVRNGSTQFPKLSLSEQYRSAKAKARQLATRAMEGAGPTDEPLAITARVYVPDNRPGHDVCNFAKCLLDAMQGVVYWNDAQVHRALWERAGVDVDAPRAELEIAPL